MAVKHFDIDDQWNPDNIAEAQRQHDEDAKWFKQNKGVWDAYWNCPCPDDEAVEVNRNYGG